MDTIRQLHGATLSGATKVIAGLTDDAWDLASQCAGWTVRELVRHMVGQNFGFAAALGEGDAPVEAYQPRDVGEWLASVDRLTRAAGAPAQEIRLTEVRRNTTFPPEVVLDMHLLDTVVHTWDICGPPWRPEPEEVDRVLALARRIPQSARHRDGPFGAVVPGLDGDSWHETLRLLGREPAPQEGSLRPRRKSLD